MSDLEEIHSALGLDSDAADLLTVGWNQRSTTGRDDAPEFLSPSTADQNLEYCGIAREDCETVLAALPRISSRPAVVALSVHLRERLFATDLDVSGWPDATDERPLLGYLYLLIAASMVPQVKQRHSALGIDEQLTRDTCGEVAGFCANHRVAHSGRPGILPGQLYWLRHYPAGRLLRVGRFEYMNDEYHHAGPVYRHRAHSWTVALADPGSHYSDDGRVQCDASEPGAWLPVLDEGPVAIIGNPVDPRGIALRETVELDRNEWDRIIGPGDPVLDMHIPAGGGMTLERSLDSFTRAFDVMERSFGSGPARAIVCRSWIFNTQIEERMPESNLARLMRELYLLPCRSGGRDGLFFVFCREYARLVDYPRETRLQRSLLDVLASGDRLRSAGMVLLRSDVEGLGAGRYRTEWAQARAEGIIPV